jgi:phenylalanine-4-hydroxylase
MLSMTDDVRTPKNLVQLDRDHPGFRDADYRHRRDEIARLAMDYQDGDPVPAVHYTEDEHQVWRTVWENLSPLHERFASKEYKAAAAQIPLERNRVPQLSEVNALLAKRGGMQMSPVAGLVEARIFLSYLGKNFFLSTQYMRHHSAPLYTPEPDVVHELVGHAATLAHPEFVSLSRAFGKIADQVDDATIERMTRVYWYTLEFGLVEEGDALKAYGAGLMSSFGELGRFENGTAIKRFDLEEVAATPFDPTDYQKVLFVAPSLGAVAEQVTSWLAKLV